MPSVTITINMIRKSMKKIIPSLEQSLNSVKKIAHWISAVNGYVGDLALSEQ